MIDYYQIFRHTKVQAKSTLIKLAGWGTFKNTKYIDCEIYVVTTIDTEQDVNEKYVNMVIYDNIEVGVSKVLEILDNYNCKARWMVTPDVAMNHPNLLKELIREKHEIGCHLHPEYFTKQSILGHVPN